MYLSHLDAYNAVGSVPASLQHVDIPEHFPQITDEDIQTGYINRYFSRQANHDAGFITEISKSTYERLKLNPLYNTVEIRWRISGKLDDIKGLTDVNTPTRIYTGVVTANLITLDQAEQQMKGMKTRILHPTQFYVGL
jgi:hypothetical protein